MSSRNLSDGVTENVRLSCDPTKVRSEKDAELEFIAELCKIFWLEPLYGGSILESIPDTSGL